MKWTERVLECQDDYEGKVISTLLCHTQPDRSKAILYVHGFIDYFFHEHVASFLVENGWNFYALDLRKYGRSILPHQTPNYCRDLKEYFEEIDQALEVIKGEGHESIVVLGHSMGGLLATYYKHLGKNRQDINGLLLNAPFLDFYNPQLLKWIVPPVTKLISRFFPYACEKNAVSPFYAKSIHRDYKGEWNFDLKKKPIKGFPAYYAWIPAIRHAQEWIYRAAPVEVPILILHGNRSMKPGKRWREDYHSADIVLNVEDMKKHGPNLGKDVRLREVPGAIHDVFLSQKKARDLALEESLAWLNQF
jgi:alpha-beta hydrolase superfamily lysophospholipase